MRVPAPEKLSFMLVSMPLHRVIEAEGPAVTTGWEKRNRKWQK